MSIQEVFAAQFHKTEKSICLIGGSGWLGINMLDLLSKLGLTNRVRCFGSSRRSINIGKYKFFQSSIEDLSNFSSNDFSILINLAFLTEDKIKALGEKEYELQNRKLITNIVSHIKRLEVDKVITISSGAVYRKQKNQTLYGEIKKEEESIYQDLSLKYDINVIVPRLFNISGPYINKINQYMMSDLIHQGMTSNKIEINAPNKVFRSFIDIEEFLSVLVCCLLDKNEESYMLFDATGGEIVEVRELAELVKFYLFKNASIQSELINSEDEDHYYGDPKKYNSLIKKYGIESKSLKYQIFNTYKFLNSQTKLVEDPL